MRFIRFPEYRFLRGVEHLLAIVSQVLVREADDIQLAVIFILCVHITKVIIYYVCFQNNMYTQTSLF